MLDPATATREWEAIAERVEAFVNAWDSASDSPPCLADFLPPAARPVRRLALAELVKIDLEFRWRRDSTRRTIERYTDEFPELATGDGVPCDLIYEEYHIRRQAGDAVDPHEYFERFPRHAEKLAGLMGLEAPHLTTTMIRGRRMEEIEVGEQLDDFDLLTRLGKGAFASVFLARQRSMQRLVALKISRDQGSEPQTMAQLDHPHIVRVYDQRVLGDRGLRLLYMQYVSGGTLHGAIDLARRTPAGERGGRTLLEFIDRDLERKGESPPVDSPVRARLAAASWPAVVCWMGARLAEALDYAHRQGVLHRDVKPANVLLAADGTPKLADFNISFSSALEGATPAAYFGGSLAYMAPEQLEACNPDHPRQPDSLDGRCDIYSLGVLLWELLTGVRPFADEMLEAGYASTLAAMADRRRRGVPSESQRRLPADSPPGLDQVLLRCLAPVAADRPATGGELARQIELCLRPRARKLLRPRPNEWPHRLRRWALTWLVLAGIVPNAIVSALNIAYNSKAIDPMDPVLLVAINAGAYLVGIGVLTFIGRQVVRAGRERGADSPDDVKRIARLRRRSLVLGDYVFWVSITAWIGTGIVIPIWLKWLKGAEAPPDTMHVHFMASTTLCGLIAATLSFMLITLLSLRLVYPQFLQDGGDVGDTGHLTRLARRISVFMAVSVAVPFLSIILLAVIDTQVKWVIGVTAGVGLVGSILAYVLARAAMGDVEALLQSTGSSGGALGTGNEFIDSFWTGSRT